MPLLRRTVEKRLAILAALAFATICIRSYVTLYSNERVGEAYYPTPRAKKLPVSFEDLMDGPTMLNSDDTRLLDYIRKYFFLKPEHYEDISKGQLLGKGLIYGTDFTDSTEERAGLLRPQSEDQAKPFGQVNQSAIVDEFLERKTNGFFIESGAWEGEYLSNTLFFERKRNWTGLLVEPNRLAFKTMVLRGTRQRSTAANVCLSINDYPRKMDFDAADVFGGVVAEDHSPGQQLQKQRNGVSKEKGHSLYKVQCLPIYSLILAAGNPTVDYLSLDIEGAEIKVLQTIPFDKVDIRTLSVEVNKIDVGELKKMMAQNGYRVLKDLKTDLIFVK